MNRYRLLIFDWDGTLMDSEARIVSCMEAACRNAQLRPPPKSAIRNIIGLGLEEAVRALLPGESASLHKRVVERYRYHFLHADKTPSPLFKGAGEMLRQLHGQGYWLAIATGKGREGLEKVLADSRLAPYFLATRCASETASKPNPAMIFELLDELGVEGESALMIGDTEYDMQMALYAGIDRLAVDYGAHPRERLLQYRPIACVSSIRDLHHTLSTRGEETAASVSNITEDTR